MVYGGMNQTSITDNPLKAIAGQHADVGAADVLSKVATVVISPGRVCINVSADSCKPPAALADVQDHFAGVSLFTELKEPLAAADGTLYAIGDQVPVAREGRVWLEVKTGTPLFDQPVYVYCGATTADRGMVTNAPAASYVKLPGARFTGRLEATGSPDLAEVQLADTAPAGTNDLIQHGQGTLVTGVCTLSDLRVTATTKIYATPAAVVTGSTNFGCLAHLYASNSPGIVGVGTAVVEALTNAGVLDADAAGLFNYIAIG